MVIIRDAVRIASVLSDVYAELGLPFAPETTGAVGDEVAGATAEMLADALAAEISLQREVVEAELPPDLLEAAARLASRHRVGDQLGDRVGKDASSGDGRVPSGGKVRSPGS